VSGEAASVSGEGMRPLPGSGAVLVLGADGSVRLAGHRCEVCGVLDVPAAPVCGACGAAEPTPVEVGAGGGTLFGWTAVTVAPPGYDGPVPYGFGIVELDEGVRVLGRLTVADPAALAFGQRMVLVADPVTVDDDGTDLVVWAFAPGDDAAAPGGTALSGHGAQASDDARASQAGQPGQAGQVSRSGQARRAGQSPKADVETTGAGEEPT